MATGFDARDVLEKKEEYGYETSNFSIEIAEVSKAFIDWDPYPCEKECIEAETFMRNTGSHLEFEEKSPFEIFFEIQETPKEFDLLSGFFPGKILPIYDIHASFLKIKLPSDTGKLKIRYYAFVKAGKKVRTKKVCTKTRTGTLTHKGYVEEPGLVKVSQPPSRYNDESDRISSFSGFNSRNLTNFRQLAAAGFFFNENVVECFSCHKKLLYSDAEVGFVMSSVQHYPNCQHELSRHRAVEVEERSVRSDGRISDAITDPPGQQSVYIPAGDVRQEVYRRTTFENFPRNCPVDSKNLAKSGFYYTGFFDRVKCFSCARTVEDWRQGDDPEDPRWHKYDCSFKRGTNSGNVPAPIVFFQRSHVANFSAQMLNQRSNQQHQDEQVLEQRDPNTGTLVRSIRYPTNLPERIRNSGGTFEIGPGNALVIQSGPGRTADHGLRIGNESLVPAAPPPRFQLANVVSSDVRRFLSNLYLNRELDRLASFSSWQINRPNVAPAALARNGFFYLGDLDRTQCFSCGGVLRNWLVEDDPVQEHRTNFRNCPMILGTETRNVAVPEQDETPDERAINYPCEHPANRHMRNKNFRVDTFDRRWPRDNVRATPAQIAEAGFFFLGERDRVKCWYCNGGLQNWEYDDNPWVEHSKWFPNCQFLLQQKGQRFVYRHLSINPHLRRPVIAKQEGSPLGEMPTIQLPTAPRRGYDISPSGPRTSTPPLEIIDPQEGERKKQEQLNNVMETSDVVKMVQAMGYPTEIVRQLLQAKIEADDIADPVNIYDGVTSLLEDVQKKEEEIQMQENQQPSAAASAPSQPPSFLSNFSSIQSNMYSIGAISSINTAPGSGLAYLSDDEEEKMDLYTTEESTKILVNSPQKTPGHQQDLPAATPEDAKSIEEMISKIQDERLCKVCLSEPADMVYIPCSHMCCCMECTKALRQCPICRAKIEKAIKTYYN